MSSISFIRSSIPFTICSCFSDSVSFSTLSIQRLIRPTTFPLRAFISLNRALSSSCWYNPSISASKALISSCFFSRSCSKSEIKALSFGCSRVTFAIDLSKLIIEVFIISTLGSGCSSAPEHNGHFPGSKLSCSKSPIDSRRIFWCWASPEYPVVSPTNFRALSRLIPISSNSSRISWSLLCKKVSRSIPLLEPIILGDQLIAVWRTEYISW